jgi:FAD/FMN-containing dehydrogenase
MNQNLVERLRDRLAGEVLDPAHPGYDDARRIWNGDIDRRPALIARCTGAADVVDAVRFAREHDLIASVRGGGHAVAGHALCDGGLVIDLSPMTGVRVDPFTRTARVEGGALYRHLDRETQAFGLAATGGIVSHTGVGGLTLGGGIGWLMRKYGLAVDQLRSCDVVTADGELIVASPHEHPELFWGLRGGGGNFGIVTSFEFELYPVGPTVLAGMVIHPMDDAPRVLRFFRDFVAGAPDEVGVMANLRLAPPLPAIPEHLHGKPIVALPVCYAGPPAEGEEILRPLRSFGSPVLDVVAPKPYRAHQQMFDPAFPHFRHYYWRSRKLPPLTDAAIDITVEHASAITSPMSSVPIFTLGGAVARVDQAETAYPNRAAAHDINIVAAWEPGDPDRERHVAWVRRLWADLEPHSNGVYVNFMSDEDTAALEAAYGPQAYRRLVSVKDKYDPANFFRGNHNVRPSSAGRLVPAG